MTIKPRKLIRLIRRTPTRDIYEKELAIRIASHRDRHANHYASTPTTTT